MNLSRYFTRVAELAFFAFLALPCSAMASSVFRTYVASTGNDSNPCSLTAPCRLLPAALAQTQDGGEVWMLDSANYNAAAVTISHSVTILAVTGALGSLVTNNADAIDMPTAGISVTLRNISVRKLGTGVGVYVTGSNSRLVVEDSEFSGLGTAIVIQASGAQLSASHVAFQANYSAISVVGLAQVTSQATLDRCTLTGPGAIPGAGTGITVGYGNVVISHSILTDYSKAVSAVGTSRIVLNDNVIAHNLLGANIDTSDTPAVQIQTTGGNTFFENTSDVYGGSLVSVTNQ